MVSGRSGASELSYRLLRPEAGCLEVVRGGAEHELVGYQGCFFLVQRAHMDMFSL